MSLVKLLFLKETQKVPEDNAVCTDNKYQEQDQIGPSLVLDTLKAVNHILKDRTYNEHA